MRCPGQDSRYWTFEDVYEVQCSNCRFLVEFFKDDQQRICNICKTVITNPKLDLSCRMHCAQAEACQESMGRDLSQENSS